MTLKRILWVAGGLILVALGFVLGQQYERRSSDVETRVDAIARTQGEIVLRAFAAGISQAVLAGRREGVGIAAVSLLHVPGIAGIHVLAPDGGVIYSSDAKLAATGEGAYRGAWALQATELLTQPSTRPDVIDMAVPISDGSQPQAIAWLEYDIAAVKAVSMQPADARRRVPAQRNDTPTDTAAPQAQPHVEPLNEPAIESQPAPN